MLISLRTKAGIALVVASLGLGCGHKKTKHHEPPVQEEKSEPTINVIDQASNESLTIKDYDDQLTFKYELMPSAKYHWTITDTNNNALSLDYGQDTDAVTVSEMTEQSIRDGIVKATCEVTIGKNKPKKSTNTFTINKQTIQSLIRANAIKMRIACLSDDFQIAQTDVGIQNQIAKMKLEEKDSSICEKHMNKLVLLKEDNATKEKMQSEKDAFNQFLMKATIYDKVLGNQENPNGGILGTISNLDIQQEKLFREARNFAVKLAKQYKEKGRHTKQREQIKTYIGGVSYLTADLATDLNLAIINAKMREAMKMKKMVDSQENLKLNRAKVALVQEDLAFTQDSINTTALLSQLNKWNQEEEFAQLDRISYLSILHKVASIIDDEIAV
jgi:hypothetical protein